MPTKRSSQITIGTALTIALVSYSSTILRSITAVYTRLQSLFILVYASTTSKRYRLISLAKGNKSTTYNGGRARYMTTIS
jgi:hypothetical protein